MVAEVTTEQILKHIDAWSTGFFGFNDRTATIFLDVLLFQYTHESFEFGLIPRRSSELITFCTIRYALETSFPQSGIQSLGI